MGSLQTQILLDQINFTNQNTSSVPWSIFKFNVDLQAFQNIWVKRSIKSFQIPCIGIKRKKIFRKSSATIKEKSKWWNFKNPNFDPTILQSASLKSKSTPLALPLFVHVGADPQRRCGRYTSLLCTGSFNACQKANTTETFTTNLCEMGNRFSSKLAKSKVFDRNGRRHETGCKNLCFLVWEKLICEPWQPISQEFRYFGYFFHGRKALPKRVWGAGAPSEKPFCV